MYIRDLPLATIIDNMDGLVHHLIFGGRMAAGFSLQDFGIRTCGEACGSSHDL